MVLELFSSNCSLLVSNYSQHRRFGYAQRPGVLPGAQISFWFYIRIRSYSMTFRLRSTSWKMLLWISEVVERSRDDKCSIHRMGNNISDCVMGNNPGRRAEPRRQVDIVISAPSIGKPDFDKVLRSELRQVFRWSQEQTLRLPLDLPCLAKSRYYNNINL